MKKLSQKYKQINFLSKNTSEKMEKYGVVDSVYSQKLIYEIPKELREFIISQIDKNDRVVIEDSESINKVLKYFTVERLEEEGIEKCETNYVMKNI